MNKTIEELRDQFHLETGEKWKNSQGEPDIDYVKWLEEKIVTRRYIAGATESQPLVTFVDKSVNECKTCNGTGQVWQNDPTAAYYPCPDCSGNNFIVASANAGDGGTALDEKKIKLALLWELVEGFQDSMDKDEDIHKLKFSYNDIEKELYDKMQEIDPAYIAGATENHPAEAEGLHPDSANLLKVCFEELRAKMVKSEKKYGWTNEWLTNDWEDECRKQMIEHLKKGDPRDVAIYAMFMMFRGWSTNPAEADEWRRVEDGLLNMNEEILIHVFKMVSLIDLSECSFEYDIDDDKNHWCNAWRNGVVIDAIIFDGNLFYMMNNNATFDKLNPMYEAYKALAELPAPPTVNK